MIISLVLRPFDRKDFDKDNVLKMEMHAYNCIRDCCNKKVAELIAGYVQAKKCSGQSHYGSYATVDYVKALPPICIHIFHPAPDKVEVKDQNIQTETVEIKDQQVQTDSIVQNQGTCT